MYWWHNYYHKTYEGLGFNVVSFVEAQTIPSHIYCDMFCEFLSLWWGVLQQQHRKRLQVSSKNVSMRKCEKRQKEEMYEMLDFIHTKIIRIGAILGIVDSWVLDVKYNVSLGFSTWSKSACTGDDALLSFKLTTYSESLHRFRKSLQNI